jgi:hypothetical protein
MNKDMMNIDDFVRDKLGGHTEKEDPAAWLRMKALLDKEMPEKAAPFIFRWGKPAAFLGAALLIGALCVGGYKLSAIREKAPVATAANPTENTNNKNTTALQENNNSFKAPDSPSPHSVHTAENSTGDGTSASNPAATTSPAAVNGSAGSGNSSIAEAQNAHTAARSQHQPARHENNNMNGAMAPHAKARHTGSASPSATTAAGKPYRNSKSTGIAQPESVRTGNNKHPVGTTTASAARSGNTGTATEPSGTNATTTAAHSSNKSAAEQRAAKKNSASAKPAVWNSTASVAGGTHKKITGKKDKTASQPARTKHSDTEDSRNIAKNKETANHKEPTAAENNSEELKDSISAISVVTRESTSRGGYPKKIIRITDTIAITKVPVNPLPKPVNNVIVSQVLPSKKAVKLAAAESRKANKLAAKTEAEKQKNTYAAAANKAEVKEHSNAKAAVPAASQSASIVKVKKEKSAFTEWWQNLNLPEAMTSAKRDFNSAQFYWGVTAGANYSFPNGSGSFQGVQFGATGELVFNKHWSLFGAIKYFNRSGTKKIVSDNFANQVADQDSTQGANWFFTARTDSTNRFFNFSTVHSFEMPVTLRYTIRKFYIMTGINLAYYLPVNVEKVEREYNNMNVHVITTNSSKPILNETKPQLTISDFGSRFGMGYVIGAGYQITPAWQTDLRIVNPFWDNAQGAGAQKLSKDFYKLPSVQLSFGYQINRIRNRATFGPNSAP